MPKARWPVASVLGLVILAGWGTPARAGARVGEAAPTFTAPELDGTTFDLAAHRGEVVVMNVWASWCPPCRAEVPVLDAFYRAHHDKGVEVIGLSADGRHDRDAVVKVAQTVRYPCAMLTDATDNGFGPVTTLPVTYVIDAHGVLRAILEPTRSGLTQRELEDVALPLLHGASPRAPAPPPSSPSRDPTPDGG